MAKELSTKLLGSKVIELDYDTAEIDTASLCASKHEAWIYVTDESDDGVPNAVEDSIIVAFTALDSSGAGCVDEIFDGVITFVTDPEEWRDTINEGYDVLNQRRKDCSGIGDCTSDYVQWGVYSGIAGVTTGLSYVGQGTAYVVSGAYNATKDAVCGKYNPFCAEDEASYIRHMVLRADNSQSEVTSCNPFDGDDSKSFFGTGWHNSNGGEHKIKITINKLYQGKTTTVYQSELAGSDKYTKEDGVLIWEPNFRKFKLNGPGTYTVTIQSLAANMDCGNPELDLTTSVVVAEAPVSEDPVEATTATLTEGVSNLSEATGTRPLYLYAGGVVLGGLLISRYMRLFSGPSEEEVSEDEE